MENLDPFIIYPGLTAAEVEQLLTNFLEELKEFQGDQQTELSEELLKELTAISNGIQGLTQVLILILVIVILVFVFKILYGFFSGIIRG
jgi:cell division protein FtsX